MSFEPDSFSPFPSSGSQRKVSNIFKSWYFHSLWASFVIVAFLLIMVRHKKQGIELPVYKAGDIATQTVRVPRTIEVLDEKATDKAKNEILAQFKDPYEYDPDVIKKWEERWVELIQETRAEAKLDKREKNTFFAKKLEVDLTRTQRSVLARLKFGQALEDSIRYSLPVIKRMKIIKNKKILRKGIELKDLSTGKTRILKGRYVPGVVSLEQAKDTFADRRRVSNGPWPRWDLLTRQVVLSLQKELISPNIFVDEKAIKKLHKKALKDFEPIFERYVRGQVIIREGEKVRSYHLATFEKLKKSYKSKIKLKGLFYEALFGALCLWLCLIYVKKEYPRTFHKKKDTWVSAFLLLTSLAAFKLLLIFQFEIMAAQFPKLPLSFFLFIVPVAAPPMIARLLFPSSLSIFFTVLFGLGASILLGKAAMFGLFITCIGIIAVMFLKHVRTRSQLYTAGIFTAIFCGIAAVALVMSWGGALPSNASIVRDSEGGMGTLYANILASFLGGFIGGWLSSVSALVMTPLFENIFGYTTDLKLLELSRTDHPLLKELVLKSPGTYHHSLLVGSLVEAGAKSIGANSLLGRVGALYHDIGKMERSEYFMENIVDKNNSPHFQLSPEQSARIIISHVTKGVVLAKRHALGSSIIDFILQHHGSSLVGYFYYQACKEAEKKGGAEAVAKVKKSAFRYPGPNPQTKESAIMALADASEASTRALSNPTVEALEAKVDSIFTDAFESGLLEEAPLSLAEIYKVNKAFKKILLAVHHNRVQYPQDKEKEEARKAKKSA